MCVAIQNVPCFHPSPLIILFFTLIKKAISSSSRVQRWPCSIMFIYSFVLIRQHDQGRPDERMLFHKPHFIHHQRWSLKSIQLMIMQKSLLLLLHHVLPCKLPAGGPLGTLIQLDITWIKESLQTFTQDTKYIHIQKEHKMHNVCLLSVFHRLFWFYVTPFPLSLSSGCFVSIKTDLMCYKITTNGLPFFVACWAICFLALRTLRM